MIDEELVIFDELYSDQFDMFHKISNILYKKGYVTNEYEEKLIEREKKYTTGIKLNSGNVAICHTNPEYALKNIIYLVHPKKPIHFKNSEDLDDISVDLVFGLVFSNGQSHLNALQNLAQVLSNEEISNQFLKADSKEKLCNLAKIYLKENA